MGMQNLTMSLRNGSKPADLDSEERSWNLRERVRRDRAEKRHDFTSMTDMGCVHVRSMEPHRCCQCLEVATAFFTTAFKAKSTAPPRKIVKKSSIECSMSGN